MKASSFRCKFFQQLRIECAHGGWFIFVYVYLCLGLAMITNVKWETKEQDRLVWVNEELQEYTVKFG